MEGETGRVGEGAIGSPEMVINTLFPVCFI